ncbi:transmembrane and coiled-coil domains 6 [Cricetulus griseus]
MWSRRQGRLSTLACGVEELRCRRREREAALRKARREQQLVSKRLLREDAPEEAGGQSAAVLLGEAEVQQFLRLAQRGTDEKEREKALVSLRRGLQHPETQQTFIRLEGSMRTLVGLLTSNRALLQLEAARCLHELSHSEQSAVAEACLPATSYLLTYLSGHSSEFIELCLYTLGNLIVESEAVRKQLLPQGIVPALVACIQSPHVAVLEALGYALSQLLQSKEAPEKIIPSLLDSSLLQHMLRLMQPGPKLNLGVAVEFAWCLHYIICSQVNNAMLLSHGALPTLAMLLLDMAGAAQRMDDAGLELLACPVFRCLSNLLTEVPVEAMGEQMELRDERIVAALFILLQFFLQKQPTLLSEGLWLLNNLTEKGPAYCQRLWPGPLLSCLLNTLVLSDIEVVGQSLELLQLLFLYQPEAAQAFLQQSGLQALERHQEETQLRDRILALQQTAIHG